ncbi:uncharacterized protein ACIB01_017992 [Guaruba guarouba]
METRSGCGPRAAGAARALPVLPARCWCCPRPARALPSRRRPMSGGGGPVLRSAAGGEREPRSETRRALPERPLRAAAPFVPPQPGVRVHTDPRVCVLTSGTGALLCAARRGDPRCPGPGDGRTTFAAETGGKSDSFHPSAPSRSQRMRSSLLPGRGTHTGDVIPLLKGMDSPITTSYQAQFTGEWSPPAKPSGKGWDLCKWKPDGWKDRREGEVQQGHVQGSVSLLASFQHTSIKFGDPRISGSMSEQKHAYSAPDKRTHRAYDKEHAASKIQHANVQLGDGCTRFSTSTSE